MTHREAALVIDVLQRFEKYWNAHDMVGFSNLFSEDAEFVNVIGRLRLGRKAIQASHEASHATVFKASTLTIHDTNVRLIDTSVAVSRSEWALVGQTSPDGKPLPERRGYLTNVLQRHGHSWLIVSSQNTYIASTP